MTVFLGPLSIWTFQTVKIGNIVMAQSVNKSMIPAE